MHYRRPRRQEKKFHELHEKTFHELKDQTEGDKLTSIVPFPERRKAASPSEFFGTEEGAFRKDPFPCQPKLELLRPEKILLGAAFVLTVIPLVGLLLFLVGRPT